MLINLSCQFRHLILERILQRNREKRRDCLKWKSIETRHSQSMDVVHINILVELTGIR